MLFRQNLSGRHHGGLVPVPGHQPDTGRAHHGFSAAHVALEQPVHGHTTGQIPGRLLRRPTLGAGELEGQGFVKAGEITAPADHPGPSGPPFPHQLQPGGEVEQLLKDQPPPGDLQLLPGCGKVEGAQSPAGLGQLVPLPDRRGQVVGNLLHAVRQNSLQRSGQQRIGNPLGAPVDRHNAPGLPAGTLPVKERIDHGFPASTSLHCAVKNVALARAQGLPHVALVEKGQGQGAGVVRRLEPGHLHAGAGPVGLWRLGHNPGHTALLARRRVSHGVRPLPVLVVPGKPVQQILRPAQSQLLQPGRPCRSDPRQRLHRIL